MEVKRNPRRCVKAKVSILSVVLVFCFAFAFFQVVQAEENASVTTQPTSSQQSPSPSDDSSESSDVAPLPVAEAEEQEAEVTYYGASVMDVENDYTGEEGADGQPASVEDCLGGLPKTDQEIKQQAEQGGSVEVVDTSNTKYNGKADDASLAELSAVTSLDLRSRNLVSSVKNQDPWQTCWAFASNAAAETSIANSSGKSVVDYSALHTAWFGYTPLSNTTSELKGTELTQAGEGTYPLCDNYSFDFSNAPTHQLKFWGNGYMPASLFMQGVGVSKQSDIPYQNSDGNTKMLDDSLRYCNWSVSNSKRWLSVARMSKMNFLGNYQNDREQTKANIKSELNKGRAVCIAYYSEEESKYLNSANYAWYVSDEKSTSHLVCIVGYDDNYSKSNFKTAPSNNGAFLVKNSWGSDWGNSGYFWLSYEDKSLTYPISYEFDTSNPTGYNSGNYINTNSELVDQYDYLQAVNLNRSSYSNSSAGWYSNIYTASQKQELHNIGTYYCSTGQTLTYKVYLLKDNATSPKDVLYSLNTPQAQGTYKSNYEGYVSIKLDEPVKMKKGQKYAIWFSQKDDKGNWCFPRSYPLEIEGYSSYKVVINSNESYRSFSPNSSWTALSVKDADTYDNYCVKGYTSVLTNTTSKVTFNSNGGPNVSASTVKAGNKVSKPSNPARSGYIFAGWYADPDLTTAYNFNDAVDFDITLYAKWTQSTESVIIFRLYNKYSREHLYTESLNDYVDLGRIGWKQEGEAWKSPSTSSIEVYRLFNRYSGEHLYTTSWKEYQHLGDIGWTREGRSFYSAGEDGVEVYRLFNPYETVGAHHYTTSKKEYDHLAEIGWTPEGVAWYSLS